jgi:SAM-dependent methyltransferase
MNDITEFLICPKCSSNEMELINRNPHCKKCGFKIEKIKPTDDTINIKPFYKIFSTAWELTKGNAVNRSFMNACIKEFVSLDGMVMDMGSGKNPSYMKYLTKKAENFEYFKADGNSKHNPDMVFNFEEEFPLKDSAFDNILLFNVLEHVYEYRFTLSQINRILKPAGKFYLYVPYFIKIHGSPLDFHRYTHFSLFRALEEASFSNIEIYTDGGLFKPLSELINWLSSIGLGYLLYPIHLVLCLLDGLLGKISGGKYLINYPTGYFVVCGK